MIRVEHLFKVFGDNPERALPLIEQGLGKDEIRERTGLTVGVNDVSFELERGEIFVIMGLSGSGKSTLLRCVNRLIEPTAGEIFIQTDDGEVNVTKADKHELRDIRTRLMSMVFQRFGLLPHRTVRDNVAYGLEIQGLNREERERIAEETLEIVGLGGWGDSKPSELSGGMQQRVGLARALATKAEVLLMDEPFSALDPLIKVNMQDELLRIQEELHRTLLFITHDLDEALRIGTRIAIMESGQVVQIGTPEEIIVNPKTEYVADFVEHADSTGVMTARTVALQLDGPQFEGPELEGDRLVYTRKGFPDIRYFVDREGRFLGMEAWGTETEQLPLREVLNQEPFAIRRYDLVLTCDSDTTLKEVLRGRTYSTLPQMVLGPDGHVMGVIGERELIEGILEKRAHREVVDAASAAEARARAAGPAKKAAADGKGKGKAKTKGGKEVTR